MSSTGEHLRTPFLSYGSRLLSCMEYTAGRERESTPVLYSSVIQQSNIKICYSAAAAASAHALLLYAHSSVAPGICAPHPPPPMKENESGA